MTRGGLLWLDTAGQEEAAVGRELRQARALEGTLMAHTATAVARLAAEGYSVRDAAADGREGLWLAGEGTYDAILCDVLLPEPDGFQVCSRLRRAGDWTPVLMLSVLDCELDEAEKLDKCFLG